MNKFIYAYRTLSHSPGNTLLKIVSIGFALAISITLLTVSAFIFTIDTAYGDPGNLYEIVSIIHINDTETRESLYTTGKIVEPIREKMTDKVSHATVTGLYSGGYIYIGDKECNIMSVGADTAYFQTMGIKVISGNPSKEFLRPNVAMVSDRFLKEELHGNLKEGEKLQFKGMNNHVDIDIIGVYESLPFNTTYHPDVVMSLPTLDCLPKEWLDYSWNNRGDFNVFVRLKDGVRDRGQISDEIDRFLKINQPQEGTEYPLDLRLSPITDVSKIDGGGGEKEGGLLSILGLTVLLIVILNYALLSISSLPQRAKNVSIHKCHGAGYFKIFNLFIIETAIIVAAASVLAFLIMYLCLYLSDDGFIKSDPMQSIFSSRLMWVPLSVIAVVILVGGVIPARVIASQPVARIFSRIKLYKSTWSHLLLFFEFLGAGFTITLVFQICAQYIYLSNKSLGYHPENLALIIMRNMDAANKASITSIAEQLPYVDGFTRSGSAPFWSGHHEAVKDESGKELFMCNIDMVGDNYAETLGMKFLAGRMPGHEKEIAVDQSFVRAMGWDIKDFDTKIRNSETNIWRWDNLKIVGVYDDIQTGPFNEHHLPDAIIYTTPYPVMFTTIRLKEPFDVSYKRLREDLGKYWGDEEISVFTYSEKLETSLSAEKTVRNIMTASSLVIILLVAMGLTGFLKNEINRMSKEIAIRKINGATPGNIYALVGKKVMILAIPSVTIGDIAANLVSNVWLGQYDYVVPGLIPISVGAGLAIIGWIYVTIISLTHKVAYSNPANSLKSE